MLPLVAVLGLVDARVRRRRESIGGADAAIHVPDGRDGTQPAAIHPPSLRAPDTARDPPTSSFATLQALAHASTRKAVAAGGVEANPVVAPLAGSPVALTVAESRAAGAMIHASERLWKTQSQGRAC